MWRGNLSKPGKSSSTSNASLTLSAEERLEEIVEGEVGRGSAALQRRLWSCGTSSKLEDDHERASSAAAEVD